MSSLLLDRRQAAPGEPRETVVFNVVANVRGIQISSRGWRQSDGTARNSRLDHGGPRLEERVQSLGGQLGPRRLREGAAPLSELAAIFQSLEAVFRDLRVGAALERAGVGKHHELVSFLLQRCVANLLRNQVARTTVASKALLKV